MATPKPLPATIARALAEWRKKLVDLTRRNRLIYFRPSKTSTLKLTEPDVDAIHARLVIQEQRWDLLYELDDDDNSEDESIPGSETLPMRLPKVERRTPPARKPNELKLEAVSGGRPEIALRNMYRRFRTDFEERGVRILYVAAGVLNWTDVERDEPVRSPLLLIPCGLERTSVLEPFRLSPVDEATVINPALTAKLKNDFNVDLPDIAESDDDLSPIAYLERCRRLFAPRGWTVSDDCWLGLFTFHKLVMYEDLKKNAGTIGTHPMIAALAGEKPDREFFGGEFPTDEQLEQIKPVDQYLVVDADRSQLACIEAARRGVSFILQGPPGTGKSQTITNLIADSIARGKTVLFVSEKMAALEVVQRRLDQARIGPFCLELHSSKANKRQVIQELAKCIDQRFSVKQTLTSADLERLYSRRQALNSYVQTLHRRRFPMDQTPYGVLGSLAEIHFAPVLHLQAGEEISDSFISDLDPTIMTKVRDSIQELLPLWDIALAGERFTWFGCEERKVTAETRDVYKRRIESCLSTLAKLTETAEHVFVSLDSPPPSTRQEIDWVLELNDILIENPGCLVSWLYDRNETLRQDCLIFQAEQERRSILMAELLESSTHAAFAINHLTINEYAASAELAQHSFGEQAAATIFEAMPTALADVNSSVTRLRAILREGLDLQITLGLEGDLRSFADVILVAELAALTGVDHKPDPKWLDGGNDASLVAYLEKLKVQVSEYISVKTQILTRYSAELFDLDLNQLVYRIGERYQSPLRYFSREYYHDCGQVRGRSKEFRLPKTWQADVQEARRSELLRARIDDEAAILGNPLGSYFGSVDTNFAWIDAALKTKKRIHEIEALRRISALCQSMLGCDTQTDPRLVGRARALLDEIKTVSSALFTNQAINAATKGEVTSENAVQTLGISELLGKLEAIQPALVDLQSLHAAMQAVSNDGSEPSWRRTVENIQRLVEYQTITRHLTSESTRLSKTYGSYFNTESTNWATILSKLRYVERLRSHLAEGPSCPGIDQLVENTEQISLADELSKHRKHFTDDFLAIGGRFVSDAPLWHAYGGGIFVDCQRYLINLLNNIDELRRWADYTALSARLDDLHFGPLLKAAIRQKLSVDELPRAITRAILQRWYDDASLKDPILERFRGENHEGLITEFRKLDREHWQLGSARVIIEANKLRPNNHNANGAGEVGILRKQAELKRRHMPLRTLFDKTANLIPRLKPCLLMSPLSVSQYLSPSSSFDVVIFDEASQICPEDAVGSIYRGKQLIVCGDHKQLPPTAFFQSGTVDEMDDEGSDEQFDLFDSILDNCRAVNMANSRLEWHYRSKHESLISFSNAQFYERQLVTFPAAIRESENLGVKFHFVEDGIYDRGGSRTNAREAEVVAEIAIEQLRAYPQKSLGVVAFSQTQMEAVQNEIERRLRTDAQDQVGMLDGTNLDGFFVKNIENVQGDERDVMIFSIGYGKDRHGQLTSNFGPINRDGGERRLNVAVTRAKEKIIVVSSIRAADIDVAGLSRPGPLNLYHYLNYAERGPSALDTVHPEGGEYESPLEESVASAIRELGYIVVPQVGVSKYRIDLGVVHPGSPGRFILGVECDGAMYHSAYLARERDRLRQYVLEQQGWKIYRVWGPDWVAQRDREVEKLSRALLNQLSGQKDAPGIFGDGGNPRSPIVEEMLAIPAPRAWCEYYRATKLPSVNPPTDPTNTRTRDAILQIVSTEAPIHIRLVGTRLADSWGFARIGDRIQALIDEAIADAIDRRPLAVRDGDFIVAISNEPVKVRKPNPLRPETVRPVEFIHRLEIESAAHNILAENVGMPMDDLVTEMARLFGFDRTGHLIADRFQKVLAKCLKIGCIRISGTMLTV
jgi:very-short-patch-repair endonuclease